MSTVISPPPRPRLWSFQETRKYLNVSESTLRRYLKSQRIEGILVGCRWKFSPEAIDAICRDGRLPSVEPDREEGHDDYSTHRTR